MKYIEKIAKNRKITPNMSDQNIAPVHHMTTSDTTGAVSGAYNGGISNISSSTGTGTGVGTGIETTGHHGHHHGHHHHNNAEQSGTLGTATSGSGRDTSYTTQETATDVARGTGAGGVAGSSYSTGTSNFPPSSTSDDSISAAPRKSSVVEPFTGSTQEAAHAGRDGSLSTTQGPFQETILQQEGQGGGIPASVGSQTAPGRAGSVGEKAMGALGYGGTHVERPKEEQGLGEKVVNFFGL